MQRGWRREEGRERQGVRRREKRRAHTVREWLNALHVGPRERGLSVHELVGRESRL